MRERGVTAAAMEVSSHALALGRVDGIFYDVALFTNLSQDHLDFHPDLDDYFAAKARLFTPELSRGRAWPTSTTPTAGSCCAAAKVPMTTFSALGRPGGGLARASTSGWAPTAAPSGWSAPAGSRRDAQIALPGPFNVANALGAIVTLVEAGVPLQTAVHGVGTLTGVPGRMQRVDGAAATFLGRRRLRAQARRGRVGAALAAPGHRGRGPPSCSAAAATATRASGR